MFKKRGEWGMKKLCVCLIVLTFITLFAGTEDGEIDFDVKRLSLRAQKSEPTFRVGAAQGGLIKRAWSTPETREEKRRVLSVQGIKFIQEGISDELEVAFFPILVREESTLTVSYFQKERIDRVLVTIRSIFRKHESFEPFISAQIIRIIKSFDLEIKKILFDELKKRMGEPLPALNKFLPKLHSQIGYEDVKVSIYAVLYAHIIQIDSEEKPFEEKIRKIRERNDGYIPLSEKAKKIIAEIISDRLVVYDETMILESVKRVFLKHNVYPYDVDSILDYIKLVDGKEDVFEVFKQDIRSNVVKALEISPRAQILRAA